MLRTNSAITASRKARAVRSRGSCKVVDGIGDATGKDWKVNVSSGGFTARTVLETNGKAWGQRNEKAGIKSSQVVMKGRPGGSQDGSRG